MADCRCLVSRQVNVDFLFRKELRRTRHPVISPKHRVEFQPVGNNSPFTRRVGGKYRMPAKILGSLGDRDRSLEIVASQVLHPVIDDNEPPGL